MNKQIKTTIILLLFIFGNIFAQTPGTVNWEFQTRGIEITSPAVDDDGTIYFGSSDSSLYALNSDGTKKWEFKTGGIITSSPAIGNNGTIYFGSHDRKLYAINPDGTKKWDYETGWKIYYAPAIGEDETIYIKSDDSYLYAFNSDGYLKWTYLYSSYESGENKDFFSSAIIDDDGIIYPVNPTIGNSIGLNPNGTENEKIIPQVEKYFKGVIDNDSNYCMRKSDSHGEGEDRFWLKLRDKNGSGGWSNDSYLYYPIIGNDETIYTIQRNEKLIALNFSGKVKWDANISLNDCSPLAMDRVGNLLVPQIGGKLTSILTTSTGLADSPWPKFNKDYKNTSRSEKFPNAIFKEGFISKKNSGIFTLDTLDASPSYDSDGLKLSYLWKLVKQPEGSAIVLVDSTSPIIQVNIPPYRGDYFFKVRVTNSKGKYSTNVVHISTLLRWQLDSEKKYSAMGLDSTLYYFDRVKFYALKPDGTTKWEINIDNLYNEIFTSTTIGFDGTIYFSTIDGYLHAINPDGTEKWKIKTDGYNRYAPAIGSDGTLYFGTSGDKFNAINPDGTKKWEIEIVYCYGSTPAIGSDGTIYIGAEYLYAISPAGNITWKTTYEGFWGSIPAIDLDGTIYIGSAGHMYAINPDGTTKWKFLADAGIFSSAVIGSDGSIYFGTEGGNFYALHADGTEKWEFKTGGEIESSPAIGNDGTIFFGTDMWSSSNNQKFYALNTDGTKKWEYNISEGDKFRPAIDNDGTIYFGNYALYSDCAGLADSPWPKSSKNNQNNSNSYPNSLMPQAKVYQSNFSMKFGTIILDGTPSFNPNGENLNYCWTIFKKPQGCILNINDSTSALTEVTIPEIPGIFVFMLKVSNNSGGASYTTITVNNELKWKFQEPNSTYYLFYSPVIDVKGNIYISSDSILYSITQDGAKKWEINLGSKIGCSPSIDQDGWIYVTTYNFNLHAIDPNGNKIWEFDHADYYTPAIGFNKSNSLENEKVIYIASEGWNNRIYALSNLGEIIWEFNAGSACYSPIIGDDGTIYFGCYNGIIYALNPDGSEKWKFDTEESHSTFFRKPSISADGVIYFTSYNGKIFALNSNGKFKWKLETDLDYYESSPVIGIDGTIYIASNEGKYKALNSDGTIKWEFGGHDYIGEYSPVIGNDGNIYISYNGFCILNSDGNLIYKYSLPNSKYYSPSINKDGTIIIRSGNLLYSIYSECKGLADSPWPKSGGNNFNSGMSHYIVPGFSADTLSGKFPLTVHFADTSFGNVFNRHWDFGDGQTSTEKNPVHTYAYPDSFTVTLIISNPSKTDTLTKENYIIALNATGIADNSELPKEFKLYENYPNPFNPQTNIEFDVKEKTTVKLRVYNVVGQLVTTLTDNMLEAGHYKYQFNGNNLASGIYFYKIEMGKYVSVKKMMLLK